MINFKTHTQAVETLLNDGLDRRYHVARNPERNDDPHRAVNGWIGIYRGSVSYAPRGVGKRWIASIEIRVEVQAADHDGSAAEDKLEDYVKEVIDVLNDDLTIGGTVSNHTGFDVEYEYNADAEIYFHAAIITIKAEVLTS